MQVVAHPRAETLLLSNAKMNVWAAKSMLYTRGAKFFQKSVNDLKILSATNVTYSITEDSQILPSDLNTVRVGSWN